ncbi:MAG: MFS transporter [Acidobacteriota bacterium]
MPTSPYRRLLIPIYLPSLLLSVSQQALLILLPLYVLELEGGAAFAAVVVGLRGLGMLLFDVPAGMMVSRFGDKPSMMVGLVCMTVTGISLALVDNLWLLTPFVILYGVGSAAWMLGRLCYMTDAFDIAERGRALSVIGGLMRLGAFAGPAIGGATAQFLGYNVAFLGAGVASAMAMALVWAFAQNVRPDLGQRGPYLAQLIQIVNSHRRSFATAGFASLGIQLMRSGRQLFIPLFGAAVGLDAAVIGGIYSLSSALDMSLFYPAGLVMDRWGRKWLTAPAMALFAFALTLFPLVTGFYSLLGVALLLGLANGFTAGIVMILGADLAPQDLRGEFLGIWRLIGDLGWGGGPLLIGVLVEAVSLTAATFAVAGIGFLGLGVLVLFMEETLRSSRPKSDDGSS